MQMRTDKVTVTSEEYIIERQKITRMDVIPSGSDDALMTYRRTVSLQTLELRIRFAYGTIAKASFYLR
jgi:hypothetical protein